MFTAAQLGKLHKLIKTVSDDDLTELAAIVAIEIARRWQPKDRPPKSPPRGEFKDCGPTRES